MRIFVFIAIALCVCAAEEKETETAAEPAQNKDKRATPEGLEHFVYRSPRKQEQVAPVEEQQDDDKLSRLDAEQYRPGQVFSLNAHELLALQPERKAPSQSSGQHLQQLYLAQDKQNVQPFYYLEPQAGRQVAIQPSRAVITRPHFSANGGEASVGAALSVSDTGASSSDPFDQELLALLSQTSVRQEERPQAYAQFPQPTVQSAVPQYQQIDRYISKPSKKPTKLRNKVQIAPPQASTAPQQYLIETTNVQQQQQAQQQQPQYRVAPQRLPQALRYVPIPAQPLQPIQSIQPIHYERPESQGLKVVAAPKLAPQQPRAQPNFRFVPQYQQPEATPKQYRLVEAPRLQPVRQEPRYTSSVERPVAYLKRYPDPEKVRALKMYEFPVNAEPLPTQPAQNYGEQYVLRPQYKPNEQRLRFEFPAPIKAEQSYVEPTKTPHSSIYVSKNIAPRKLARPQKEHNIKIEQPTQNQPLRFEQPSLEQVNIEQHGQSLDEQRAHLPPPRNNRAYTPEEFAALVAAGYSVTPIPVSSTNLDVAQSRSSVEVVPSLPKRRPLPSRRHQYLPVRDDAP